MISNTIDGSKMNIGRAYAATMMMLIGLSTSVLMGSMTRATADDYYPCFAKDYSYEYDSQISGGVIVVQLSVERSVCHLDGVIDSFLITYKGEQYNVDMSAVDHFLVGHLSLTLQEDPSGLMIIVAPVQATGNELLVYILDGELHAGLMAAPTPY
jgi:hypothetical protein